MFPSLQTKPENSRDLALSDPELEKAISGCVYSTKACAKSFFPEQFFRPFSPKHEEIFEAIDDDSIRNVLVLAPRGSGKTSLVTKALAGRMIIFRQKKYIIMLGNTHTNILRQCESLKRALINNKLVKQFFGDLKGKDWAKDFWRTSTGISVFPRGAGQAIRGVLEDHYRPDLIIADDLEQPEETRSEEQREQLDDWWWSDVMYTQRSAESPKVVVIGTLLHEDSLLARLKNDPSFHVVMLDLCDDDLTSHWPEFMATEEIKREYESFRQRGKLALWYRENRNQIVPGEEADFTQSMFRYYDEDGSLNNSTSIMNAVLLDPAKTTNRGSCDTAIVGVAIDPRKGRVYVRDIVAGQLKPDEIYNEAFAMCKRLNARHLAVEVTSLNEFIMQPLQSERQRRREFVNIVELKARGGTQALSKQARVAALSPYYRLGQIYHNKSNSAVLEGQLLSFPRSKRWDVMDALAYSIELMSIFEKRFMPEPDPRHNSEQEEEAEFRKLEQLYKEPILGARELCPGF